MTQPPEINWCTHALAGHAPRACGMVRSQVLRDADGQPVGRYACRLCGDEKARTRRAERKAKDCK